MRMCTQTNFRTVGYQPLTSALCKVKPGIHERSRIELPGFMIVGDVDVPSVHTARHAHGCKTETRPR